MKNNHKNKNQRSRQLAKKTNDIGIIKIIKDRKGNNNNFEYLVEWQGPTEDSWHAEQSFQESLCRHLKMNA